jgi:L-ascorbate metabolism protein UlaG (beta-lactamase superfamily)
LYYDPVGRAGFAKTYNEGLVLLEGFLLIEYSGIDITWLGHDCFRIEGEKTIYTDPFKIGGGKPADLILITHSHFDHLSPEDIQKIWARDTVVVAPKDCQPQLNQLVLKEVKTARPEDRLAIEGVEIRPVPAYNINKFRSPGIPYHPKHGGGVGYVFTIGGVTFYHTGDTDLIPEMENLKIDVMFTPVSGTYVMTVDEAVRAVKKIAPKLAIPMHYGIIVGSQSDAERFSQNASCRVEILETED